MYFTDEFWQTIKTLYNVETLQGYTVQEIQAMQKMCGTLPKVLEEFYQTVAKTPAFHCVQDKWITPEYYQKHPETWHQEDMLLLLAENQWVCCAGIKKEDLHLDNPPVYVTEDNKQYFLSAQTTSEFIAAVLLYQASFAMKYVFDDVLWLDQENFEKLEEKFERYPFMFQNWLSAEKIVCYYYALDHLVNVWDLGGQWQMLYGATNEAAFEKLHEDLADLGESV